MIIYQVEKQELQDLNPRRTLVELVLINRTFRCFGPIDQLMFSCFSAFVLNSI